MRRLIRLLLAFAGFMALASVAVVFFFGACIALFDPLAGASGSLARENPPSLWQRLVFAVPCGIAAFVFFLFAALVAKHGLSLPALSGTNADTKALPSGDTNGGHSSRHPKGTSGPSGWT